jgi:hypothetical protein
VVEVFKTNVTTKNDAKKIISALQVFLPLAKINFDLEDCDKILRIESSFIDIEKVILLLNKSKFQCESLE